MDHPMLFSAPMMAALLNGSMRQTRLTIRPPSWAARPLEIELDADDDPYAIAEVSGCFAKLSLRYAVGDRLWVREAWTHDAPDLETCRAAHEDALGGGQSYGPYYRATEMAPDTLRWRSPLHMPRWASRLTLTVTEVRVQQVQEISEADAKAEGIQPFPGADGEWWFPGLTNVYPWPVGAFIDLWDRIHGKGAWERNDWIVALTFTLADGNIDALPVAA